MSRAGLACAVLALGACHAAPSPSLRAQRVTASPIPTAAPTPAPTSAPTIASCAGEGCFDPARAMAYDRVLSVDIGIRRAAKGGDRTAAGYIAAQLAGDGLDARLDPFTLPAGGETWNVVASPPGFSADTARYVIVGGHYDTTQTSPGGNDNGSGVAAILDMARAVRAQPGPLPVVFVAFGAEEVQPGPPGSHHLGSKHYVSSMSDAARRNLVVMFDLDEVGVLVGTAFVCGRLSTGPREGTDRLLRLAAELGIPAGLQVTPDWSDNGTFLKAGMDAAWLWSGQDPVYHSPGDVFDRVQPATVERAGRLMLAAVRSYS